MDSAPVAPFLVLYFYDHELNMLPFTAANAQSASAKAESCLAQQGLQDTRIIHVFDEEAVAHMHEHMTRVRSLLGP